MKRSMLLMIVVLSSACSAMRGEEYGVYELHESFNRASYQFSDHVDRVFAAPLARGYKKIAPDVVERGITNVFANLGTVASSANGFLQGKPRAATEDFGRFLVNSTLGVGGIFDVASQVGLKHHNEDFGQTLAVWGWKRSRYVYIPFLGPSTLRDLPTTFIRSYIPRLILGSSYHWGLSVAGVVSSRANLLVLSDTRDASAIDPYAFTRDGYIQHRKFLIYDGDLPMDDLFDDFEEFEEFEELDEELDEP